MKLLIMASVLTSSSYFMSSHPVLLVVLILVQTMILCLTAWATLKMSWFSYILFLVFLGGLMVLFIYITSLASNELIQMKMFSSPSIIFLLIMFLLPMIIMLNQEISMFNSSISSLVKTFNLMYSWNSTQILLITMIYLLLTLIIVVKICNKFDAPLKNLIFK